MDDKAPYIAVKVPEKGDNRGKKSKFCFYGNTMYFQNVIINQINVILKQM